MERIRYRAQECKPWHLIHRKNNGMGGYKSWLLPPSQSSLCISWIPQKSKWQDYRTSDPFIKQNTILWTRNTTSALPIISIPCLKARLCTLLPCFTFATTAASVLPHLLQPPCCLSPTLTVLSVQLITNIPDPTWSAKAGFTSKHKQQQKKKKTVGIC